MKKQNRLNFKDTIIDFIDTLLVLELSDEVNDRKIWYELDLAYVDHVQREVTRKVDD